MKPRNHTVRYRNALRRVWRVTGVKVNLAVARGHVCVVVLVVAGDVSVLPRRIGGITGSRLVLHLVHTFHSVTSRTSRSYER